MLTFVVLCSLQDLGRLAEDLRDDRIDVRDHAERELQRAGARAIPHIVPLLDTQDPELRYRVESVLRSAGLDAVTTLERHGARDWAQRLVRHKAWSHLKRDCCRVELRDAPEWPAVAELEAVTDGHLHRTVSAYRFRSTGGVVDVLRIERGRDTCIRRTQLRTEEFAGWLRVLATVHTARVTVEPEWQPRDSTRRRSVWVRIREDGRLLMERSYSGLFDGQRVGERGNTESAVGVVWSMVRDREYASAQLTDEEKEWFEKSIQRLADRQPACDE